MERLADEGLRDLGPVRVRGVAELDSELRGAPQEEPGGRRVGRLAPRAATRQRHRPEPQRADGEPADHRNPSPDWPCVGGGKSA